MLQRRCNDFDHIFQSEMLCQQESLASSGNKDVPTGGKKTGEGSSEPEKVGEWGTKGGTGEDMEILADLIKAEMRKPENKGKYSNPVFCS